MATEITYSKARANLASLLDQVTDNREVVIITRRDGEDVAVVAAAELRSLLETAHLLRSRSNASRLLKALDRARNRKRRPQTLERLRRDVGID